jgi:hypothetical protein
MTAAAIVLGSLLAVTAIYLLVVRPWHLRFGATDNEVELHLPGDELVHKPDFNATRAISINAPPPEIWKWIVQIGSGRAGWYSVDWIDNGGRKSSSEVLPEYQNIEAGQFIPFTPDQKQGMWVKDFKEDNYILWVDKKGKATWLWYIYETGKGRSRLITRLRTRYTWNSLWIIYYLLYDVGDIVMMRKCMHGIKKRAEKAAKLSELVPGQSAV